MAGIYLHIPFCKQACHYCDFYFSTNTSVRAELVHAMAEEISLQRDYLEGESIRTIYFGGGTPSILDTTEIGLLLERIYKIHRVADTPEVTLEANPDDLDETKLNNLKSLGVNRLSIGIQSFDDALLARLNRVHTASTAMQCVSQARDAGFRNISIDLIYAIPGLSSDDWRRNIASALQLETQHISAYTLTIEERTVFGNWVKKGLLRPVEESVAAEQMELLVSELATQGYRQYEISNFAKPGYESLHNSNYWEGGKYLGIGPSAHSYNQRSRQHNVSNNHHYIRAVRNHEIPAEVEILRREEQINEYILTSLRTAAGCDLDFLKSNFGYDMQTHHDAYLNQLAADNLVRLAKNRLQLTEAGKLFADKISSDLFLVE